MKDSNLVEKVRAWWQEHNAYLSIPYLDTQHLWLARLITELGDVLENEKADNFEEKYQEFLQEATRYAEKHFRAEEELMQTFHYPAYGQHKKRHENFAQSLSKLKNRPISKENALLLYRFLRQWLVTHILKDDRHFASFFARRRFDINAFFDKYSRSGHGLSEKEKSFYQEVLGEAHHLVELNKESLEKIQQTFTSLRLQTGIPIIDIQHLWLIKLVVELEDSLKTRQTDKKELFLAIFSEVFRYAKEHFTAEEIFMQAMGFSELASHREKHQLFVKDLDFKYKVYGQNLHERVAVSLLKDLREWLFTHIALEDKKLSSLVEKNPEKASAISRKLLQDKKIRLLPVQIALYRAIIPKLAVVKK